MSTLKVFTTAHLVDETEIIDIPIRAAVPAGEDPETGALTVIKAYRPGDGQMALLMQSLGQGSTQIDSIAGPLNFFDSVLDNEGKEYIKNRLLDRRDPFGIEQVEQIMASLMEEWTGRPTQPPSGSASSQPNGGANSTPTTQPSREDSPASPFIANSV